LAVALKRHLEQFPAVADGLSRSERQILELVAVGTLRPEQLFHQSAQREERPFLGDVIFWSYIAGLADGSRPLLTLARGGRFVLPHDWSDEQARTAFHAQELALTKDGRAVLSEGADWIALSGRFDRWLGGVHLSGAEAAWRWDRQVRRLHRFGDPSATLTAPTSS